MQIEVLWAIHNIQMPCQMTWWSCRFMCLDAEKGFSSRALPENPQELQPAEKSQSLA